MKLLKYFCLLLLLALMASTYAQPSAPKPKRIYITLDVSGSMEGNKYVMANYAAQMISVFSGEDDKTVLYYFGEPHELSGAQDYKTIQFAYDQLDKKKKYSYHEISDLTCFLKDYLPNPDYEDWLFIIGDGDWAIRKGSYDSKTEFESTWKKLKALLLKEDLQVCYLQTGDRIEDHHIFTDSLTKILHPTIGISKSDTTAQSVLDNCNEFVNRILGFSNQPIVIKQESDQCISFESEFPLERFVIIHQSGKTGKLEIGSVAYGAVSISGGDIKLKGNPSTQPLINGKGASLNGEVWEVCCQQGIPANEKVKVCFDAKVDASNLRLYPYVDVLMQMRPWGRAMDTLNELSHNVFAACDTLTQLNVVLTLTDHQGHKFSPPLMKKMDVQLVVDGSPVIIDYESVDTTFRAIVPILDDKVSYFVIVESPGYFRRSTADDPQTIQKTMICKPDPEIVSLDTLPIHYFDAVKFKTLIEGKEFGGQIDDSLFGVIAALGDFDEQIVADMNDYPYAGDIGLQYNSGQIRFTHQPNSTWCECAFPDTLRYWVVLRSKLGILHDDKVYQGFVIPVSVQVDKRQWVGRCWNQQLTFVIVFVIIIYLLALLKKRRFKKTARMENSFFEDESSRKETQKKGRLLREPGMGPWLNRWLNPFVDEKRSMSFSRPKTKTLTFIASKSKERILLSKGCYDERTMNMANYVPQPEDSVGKQDDIRMAAGEQIEIMDAHRKKLGHLTFTTEQKDDESGFRFIIIVMLLLGLATDAYLLFVLVRSLL